MGDDDNLLDGQRTRMSYKMLDRYLLIGTLVCIVGVFVAVIVGATASTASINSNTNDKISTLTTPTPTPDPDTDTLSPLPHSYVVPAVAVTPVKNQQSRGTCWAFSGVGILEASYRKNGVEKGFLNENEYVRFSEQAYALDVVDYCSTHKDDPVCYGSGPIKGPDSAQGYTDDGTAEWIYYLDGKIPTVLPETACPYTTQAEEGVCPERKEKQEKNPLRYTVKHIKSAYSISDIKRLLYTSSSPLTWSHMISTQTYAMDCSENSVLGSTVVCEECRFPVDPSDLGKGCLVPYELSSYDDEGVFSLHGQPYFSGGHATQVVGYNDNYRIDTGPYGDLSQRTVGGFIIKNSWGAQVGHSMNHWAQKISLMEEATLCPSETAATKWIPANYECVMKGDQIISQCGDDQYKRVRDQWVQGSTILKCTSLSAENRIYYGFGECNDNYYYSLITIPQYASGSKAASGIWTETSQNNHLVKFFLAQFESLETTTATIVSTELTSWKGIESVLTPFVDKTNENSKYKILGNDPDYCGFYFLPYQYVQEANVRFPVFGHDTPNASHFHIEWEDSSYAKNSELFPQFDYQYVKASTKTMTMRTFDGPFDFTGVAVNA